jgi:serine/threonine protein kinase
MIQDKTEIAPRQDQLNDVLLAYVEAVQAGQAPDRAALLAAHPQLADDLREFFRGQDQMDHFTAALRETVTGRPAVAASVGELGDFRLLREVGHGGMGVVYEAEQISLHRRVALKMLPFAAALDPRQLQRFRIEAQAAAQLHHTNIVPVFAVGEQRGVHYYAMQFIDGQSLAALIDELRNAATPLGPGPECRAGLRPPAKQGNEAGVATDALALLTTAHTGQRRDFHLTVARLGKQAAEALEHAHQMGVVHRDIKPGNLLLDDRGQLWVTDFGLAQFRSDAGLTATGEVLGTLRYASPEQCHAHPGVVDQRSDIYSLGATLYELLTLRPVFDGKDRAELLRQITFDEPLAPRALDRSIPVELETIILKAVAKNPADRYRSARELADDLGRFLEDRPILARRPSLAERAARWSRRHRSVVVSALILLAAGVIGLSVSTFLIARAYEGERDKAEEARIKAKEARDAQARAEEDFRLAKRAIDKLTELGEEELASNPMLQSTRRKMLIAALSYYQEFLDRHGDDPAVQPELAASYARVSRLLAELSALEGYGQLMLVFDRSVQDDLKATASQREQIWALGGKIGPQWGKTLSTPLSAEQRQTKLAELARDHARAVLAILTPEQGKRLQQIGLQWQQRGPDGFRDPDLIAALGLTAKQVQEIRKLQQEALQPPAFGGTKGKGPPDFWERHDKLQQKILQDVFTADQRNRWQAMIGEPFTGPLFGPPPGGFGMGFGPPPGSKGPPRD